MNDHMQTTFYCPRCGGYQPCDLGGFGTPCRRRRSPSPGTTHDELVLAQWLAGAAGHDADARAEAWTEACDPGRHRWRCVRHHTTWSGLGQCPACAELAQDGAP